MEKVFDKILANLPPEIINPKKLLYDFKGIPHRHAFRDYFPAGGITGGFLDYEGTTNYWKGGYEQAFDKAGGFGVGDFCFVVMNKFGIRKNRMPGVEYNKQTHAREIAKWRHVKAIFMTEFVFNEAKHDYLSLQSRDGVIPWEKFCDKVRIVSTFDNFMTQFGKFLNVPTRSNLTEEQRTL